MKWRIRTSRIVLFLRICPHHRIPRYKEKYFNTYLCTWIETVHERQEEQKNVRNIFLTLVNAKYSTVHYKINICACFEAAFFLWLFFVFRFFCIASTFISWNRFKLCDFVGYNTMIRAWNSIETKTNNDQDKLYLRLDMYKWLK